MKNTAQQLKERWPIYPEMIFEDKPNGSVGATTLIRKNFDGKYYLILAKQVEENRQSAKLRMDSTADLILKHYRLTEPGSFAATQGCAMEVLDDNQED